MSEEKFQQAVERGISALQHRISKGGEHAERESGGIKAMLLEGVENDKKAVEQLNALRAERDSLKTKLDGFMSVHGDYNSLTLQISDLGRERDSLAAQLAEASTHYQAQFAAHEEEVQRLQEQLAESKRHSIDRDEALENALETSTGNTMQWEQKERRLSSKVDYLERRWEEAKRQNAGLCAALAVKDAALHGLLNCAASDRDSGASCYVIAREAIALKPAGCLSPIRNALNFVRCKSRTSDPEIFEHVNIAMKLLGEPTP